MDAGSVESLFAGYPDVRLRLVSRSAHTSQVVTGFLMLARRRRIALTIEDAGHRREEYPHPHLVEAFVGGRRIAFDMLDGYNFDVVAAAAYIRGVDLYFKRSCSTFRNGVFPAEVRAKIRPLGFNYHVTCPENPINPVPVEIKSLRKRLIALLRPRPAEEGEYFTVEKFECGAGRRVAAKRLKILFLTRLWEGEQNRAINAMRIAIVRALGERYPRNFTGGVTDTPLARALCPELIVAEKYTDRARYLRLMRRSDICIGSTGLWDSIGWKTGEYVAAARAVVNERFVYEVPGGFREGVNYLGYASAEECVAQVDLLMRCPDAVQRMKEANAAYYREWLRPDALVGPALRQAEML